MQNRQQHLLEEEPDQPWSPQHQQLQLAEGSFELLEQTADEVMEDADEAGAEDADAEAAYAAVNAAAHSQQTLLSTGRLTENATAVR